MWGKTSIFNGLAMMVFSTSSSSFVRAGPRRARSDSPFSAAADPLEERFTGHYSLGRSCSEGSAIRTEHGHRLLDVALVPQLVQVHRLGQPAVLAEPLVVRR